MPWELIVFPTLMGIGALVLLYFGMRCLRRKRLIENVPTSKVKGVFLGLTEVKGETETPRPLRSYLAEAEVVYYSFSVEEHWRRTESYTDSKGNRRTRTVSGWRTVRSDEVRRPFSVRDDTGAIRVRPERAEIQADRIFSRTCGRWDPLYYSKGPRYAVANSTHRRRFTEHAVRVGQAVYVMGNAKLREDVLEPELRYDPDDELFLISTGSEEQIIRSYAWKSIACLLFGFLLAAATPPAFHAIAHDAGFGDAIAATLPLTVGVAALFWLAVFVLYLQLVYNGLINVKNRLEQAFSMIDVQLKRRHDLIPNLVALVKGYATHEQGVQEGLAKIRTEGFAGRGALGLPDDAVALLVSGVANEQTAKLKELFTYVERYPDLKADSSFLRLHDELARTEEKIALARTFYNESVTAYNNRIETMPDLMLAKPLRLEPGAWLTIEAFEQRPVEVRFEEEPEALPEPADFAAEEVPEDAVCVSDEEIEAAQREEAPQGS